MNREARSAEIRRLREQLAALEAEQEAESASSSWPPSGYYTTYHLLAGMTLGMLSAGSSLLVNIVGASMVGKHPLELIRVYLTFPMGEGALNVNSGVLMAAGCCLYLGTGMVLGIPFHLINSRFFSRSPGSTKFLAASGLGLVLWLISFYGVLSWLQPLLIGGSWIVDGIPWYVAASTHLVFGWTMLLFAPWGRFVPYRGESAEATG